MYHVFQCHFYRYESPYLLLRRWWVNLQQPADERRIADAGCPVQRRRTRLVDLARVAHRGAFEGGIDSSPVFRTD